MKNILGLDLGTNSIGWALIQQDFENKEAEILGMGSRIIPMSQDILGEFGKGNSVSQTAGRTGFRGVRRIRERYLLRRERLHRVLNILGFLPEHFANQIDFEKRLGQFKKDSEPKLAYNNNEFIFQSSFDEMMNDFRVYQPEFINRLNRKGDSAKIPYDWTIFYLRKKALSKKIAKEELAWILLNFNQKRGYYQLRGEEEEDNPNKLVEFYSMKIVDVQADGPQKGKSDIWYSLILENGWIYRRSSKIPLFDWIDKVRDFIVTTDLNIDGSIKTDKDGIEKRSFRAPNENDWTLVKKKTEQEIEQSKNTVGTFIYDTLLQTPNQKIKGKLIRTIERKFYKEELNQILTKQKEFYKEELDNDDIYNYAVRELYRNNEAQQIALEKKNIVHLFLEDIIFYQRPLKSKKSSIGDCSLEYRIYKDSKGVEQKIYLKTIAKSHPLYQEFRLWQWIYNLGIYLRDNDSNVNSVFFNRIEDYENLFEFLNERKEVTQDALLKHLIEKKLGLKGKALTSEVVKYRWNFIDDKEKKYPCNETYAQIKSRLEKVVNVSDDFLTTKIEIQLWHIIYSVTDKIEYEKALKTFALKYKLDEISFVENFRKFPPFKSDYGAYSEKAIKKLLPLMRIGKFWNWDIIDGDSKARIDKIITGEYDENIKNRVREKSLKLTEISHFQGLQLWLASYIIYDRHSEASLAGKWNSPKDLKKYLQDFKQHSLRNPIVEQVVTETLRVVIDIWEQYGNSTKDYFSEIHIELGREMKNTADDRKRLSNLITGNENTNLRLKALLIELQNDQNVVQARSYSPSQLEVLKIYEDGVLNSNIDIPEDILKISKTAQPSTAELLKYKLWLEQKYRSPYTGEIIPLNKLFTSEYQIEHIIPQSRYFDDSFTNKVICESAVNQLKDKQLGLEFIKEHHGEIIETGFGKKIKVFEVDTYEAFVKEHYSKNHAKKNKLLLEEIPEKMIERQLNDTRYISKFISNLLSNIVRSESNDDGINSKNIIPVNGKITSQLKQDWGLNDVWNDLILPRFERMNQITNSDVFTTYNEKFQKYLPTVPLEYSKGFQKKRIDHRHHALDALIIACATRDHVNLLNNKHAKAKVERYDLKNKLMNKKSVARIDKKTGNIENIEVFDGFKKPWKTITEDTRNALIKVVVSFKQNLRVINKATNKYEKWVEEQGELKKKFIEQKGLNWAIRKPMHKETVSGKVNLSRVTVPKNKTLTATRKSLDTSFNLKSIQSITDTGIQKILRNYLTQEKFKVVDVKENVSYNSELAFSPEGIEEMNNSIEYFNDGKKHQPIFKVRVFEVGSKFSVGQIGNKKDKYVEAAKGTNLFFAIYWDEEKQKRSYETIPLNEIIEHQKWRASLEKTDQKSISIIPVSKENGKFLFSLSPNDLIYVPNEDEDYFDILKVENIYKVVSFTGNRLYAVPYNVAISIVDKVEFTQLNKVEFTIDKKSMKGFCIKLNVDRLGNLSVI